MRVNVCIFVSGSLGGFFVGEAVDDHDEMVVEVGRVCGFDQRGNEVGKNANVVCSAPQAGECPDGRPGRLERWLLFDNAVFALVFVLAGTGRGDFARLHELADVSVGSQTGSKGERTESHLRL